MRGFSHRSIRLLFLLAAPGSALAAVADGHAGERTFEKDIRPILKAQCFHCHGEDGEMKGELDVRLARFILKGGESGPAVVAGKPHESHLLELVKSGEMPKGKAPLSPAQIRVLEEWIARGAKTARPEPEQLGPEHAFTDEERAWWAFQPIQRPPVPQSTSGANPIDAFIEARLREHGLSFSAEAPAATLIRRLSVNLTGLPPTPQDVAAFEADHAAQPHLALDRLITRLLGSSRYGERWSRMWLDVAGYADSDGYSEKDIERPHAFKFRDYVIAALNTDKPFDAFVREQLAGDEIAALEGVHADSPAEADRARYDELLRATGFLRMAPDGTAVTNSEESRNACVADTLKIVSTALYGMTIGCAQCHDHRYDPISQADYYRLRAVFEPALDPKTWRTPAGRLVSLQTKEERAEADRIEAEAKKIDAERVKQQEVFITEVLEKELLEADEPLREALRTAYRTDAKKRTADQTTLLKKYPRVNQLSVGSLYLYDTRYKTKHADTLKKMTADATAVRATKPTIEYVQALTEPVAAKLPATHLFHRGNFDQPRQEVKPGDLTVLAAHREVELPLKDATVKTSGRRLAFARSITDGKHPLLARVIVNRVWMQHFGRGIVSSVGDFGVLGQKPTHPELLDWLATEFMTQGWSLKHLHRMILTSRTYRQSSRRDDAKEGIDPDNLWFSRINLRRLEAETLRDALLAVSGQINDRVGGPPVPVMFSETGQVVLGIDTTDTAGRQTGKYLSLNGEEFRRSIYVQARRSRPLEMFAAFDAPAMTEANCEIRPITTVSPQSLLLMNNGYMREYAQFFAQRVLRETPEGDLRARVAQVFELALSRTPSMSEVEGAVAFVKEQTAHYEAHPTKLEYVTAPVEKENAPADLLGLAALCHALISSNEFLYVD